MKTKETVFESIEYYYVVTKIYFKIIGILLSRGIFLAWDLWRFPWLFHFLNLYKLYQMMRTRKGSYREASIYLLNQIAILVATYILDMLKNPETLVLAEDIIPPEIIRAMGLTPFSPEIIAIMLTIISPNSMEKYIDVCENSGIPADLCSLPKCAMGMTLANELPKAKAIIASNLPCDAGMASYTTIQKNMGIPTLRVDVPYHFRTDRAVDYFKEQLEEMIAFLEKHTVGRMDWNKLREICDERNLTQETEKELWDLAKLKPSPIGSELIYLSHLVLFNIFPGDKRCTEVYKNLIAYGKKSLKQEQKGAIENESYRILLWNPPMAHFPLSFSWAEEKYGAIMVMDSMTFNVLDPIDTTSHDTILRGLSTVIMQGPMSRHVRGPAENYFNDIFFIQKHFQIDILWVADNIGCKMSAGLNEILRSKCRENNIPMLLITYDLMDRRFAGPEDIMAHIDHFMETIMVGSEMKNVPDIEDLHLDDFSLIYK